MNNLSTTAWGWLLIGAVLLAILLYEQLYERIPRTPKKKKRRR